VADIGLGHLGVFLVRRVAGNHAETRLEGRRLAAGDVVNVETAVVDELALGTAVAHLGHAPVGAVLGLEEEDGGPVVGHILLEAARRAGRLLDQVMVGRVHGDVEAVAADDLVQMGRVELTRVDDGVGPLDDKLRAREAQHVLGGRILREQRGRE